METDAKQLNITSTSTRLNNLYNEIEEHGYNIIGYGDSGTGKTTGVPTLPFPIYYQSWDRHGWSVIKSHIDGRKILCDTRFETMFGSRVIDNKGTSTYTAWEMEFKRLEKIGFFDAVGSFVIDSATTWANAIMDETLKRSNKRLGTSWMIGRKETPDQKDWQIQMDCIKYALDNFLGLPCNCYLICHAVTKTEEDTGRTSTAPLLTGKLSEQIPPLFDEVYKTHVISGANAGEYKLLTQHDGNIVAKSRLSGKPPKLAKYEEFDFRKIMEKVEVDASDKPLFTTGAAENEVS